MPDIVGVIGWHLRRMLPREVFVPMKTAWKSVQSRRRAAARATMPRVSREQLLASLRAAGICEGDTLFVHSSLSKIGDVEGGADTVVSTLLEAVGPSGNVVMPAYTSADEYVAMLERGELLDLRTQRSLTGKITEALRMHPGTLRSSHPFSSSIAYGPQAQYITGDHGSASSICHENSPLARVLELDGKLVGLGTNVGTISMYHLAEDLWDGFPFQTYGSPFAGRYVDADGGTVERDLLRYDPDVSKYRIDQPMGEWIRKRMDEHLRAIGLLRPFTYGCAASWTMDMQALYDEVCRLAANGVTIYSRPSDAVTAQLASNLQVAR